MNQTNQVSERGQEVIGTCEVKALGAFDTPTIANALEVLGVNEVHWLGPEVRAMNPVPEPMVGIAVTATVNAYQEGEFDHLQSWLRFLETIEELRVPVITVFQDTSPTPGQDALLGEGMALAMRAAGVLGAITDGCVRDVGAFRLINFPVLARGAVVARGRTRFQHYQVPVQVSQMKVMPGEIIHADENGALVIPVSRVKQVLDVAAQVVAKEAHLFAMLRDSSFSVERLREWYRRSLETTGTKSGMNEHG